MKISCILIKATGIVSIFFLVALLTGGCQTTTTYRVNPDAGDSYDFVKPINMTVQLHLSNDFQNKTVNQATINHAMWGPHRDTVQFGEALCHNSIQIAHSLFQKVVITKGRPLSSREQLSGGIDATLEPRFESLLQNEVYPNDSFQTVTIFWVLKDRHGVEIWSDTFSGTNKKTDYSWGFSLPDKRREGIQQALTLSFTNATEAISRSSKIRRFAEMTKQQDR